MTSQTPVILAFDTSAAHCAAALLRGTDVVAAASEEMGRGQAERLMPLLDEVVKNAGLDWSDLTAIAVGIGPGNFTGIRISVSAARGLALALNIPAVGVSTFDAISASATLAHLAVVPAPQDKVYIAPVGSGPSLTSMGEAHDFGLPLALPPAPADLVVAMAGVAHRRILAGVPLSAPAPLYIRAADAAPARDAAPVMLPDDDDGQ
ncbi:MAG: tRNA (adenosine(37)-N6)-threonylcarbamoyltransferase complex dimerization subunit type 1 TsaB [Paracoccaceae bacterium]|uniref:tRNA (adenosine(37)-N6)-threonylcarbamoyltransferase complex dimerization subunit type 1 TsaB n=1 Tax=Seohaeicola saemankumensis TaxID=481181 RepID=UPI001E45A7BF|nr:tRNA (adenosine(37)-N6)-threonylcarbamoyltransferase complex dimerization subunit type 1 TsaB [Seohaeicola saemankumensis]MCD1626128.1 tRNA (adenosine(37)-N6)-threonylcarbamoyltransferase complex dimerization subunit type 1 TsaB [Seohaeicola saemankumensis]